MSKEITKVFSGFISINLVDNEVHLVGSNRELSTIIFPLELLEEAISKHITKISRKNFLELRNKYLKRK
jgi:hypothetical protein